MKNIALYVSIGVSLMFFSCAQSQQKQYKSPKGYNFKEGTRYKMPEELLEISGHTFKDGDGRTLYAIQDEDGKLFYGKLTEDMKVSHSKFGKHGDYEDIAINGDQVIVLKSNGKLYMFPISEIGEQELSNVKELVNILPAGEYESMYADAATHKLYVLCKNCAEEKTTQSSTGYVFNIQPNDSLQLAGNFKIEVKQITKLLGDDKIKFRPSAMAKNPITKEWFIVSAVNGLLVVADDQWQVKEVYPLNHKTFLQPEGIAFDKKGNLYISSEGDEFSKGSVIKFTRF